MELSSLIPYKFSNDPNWIVKKKFLCFRKLEHIPICFIEDGIIYVFLDARISKQVLEVINQLSKLKVEFYCTSPELSNPKGVFDFHNLVIKHYFVSYSNKYFYYKLKKIENFDLIQNMVDWCKKEKCIELIKENYEEVNHIISKRYYDYYNNRYYFDYDEEIIDEFSSLYRDIQINMIL